MKFSIKKLVALTIVFFILLFSVLTAFEVGNYKKYYFYCREICLEKGIEVSLVLAVIRTESSFNETAVSNKGAVGLMQIMPKTAEYIAKKVSFDNEIDLFNVQTNLYLGICYIKYLFEKYVYETVVLACYNAGEGRVQSWVNNGELVIPITETKNYIKRVKRRKKLYGAIV